MSPSPPSFSDPIAHQCTQVLYRCLEEVGSTKGALYLRVPQGQEEAGAFRQVSEYGWPRGTHAPEWIQPQAPLLIWVQREKRVFAVNEPSEYPELAPFSEGSDSPRFLLAPIYLKGDWVGLLMQRDRIKGVAYDLDRDEKPTLRICNDVVEVLSELRLYHEAPELSPLEKVTPRTTMKAIQAVRGLTELGATMPMPVAPPAPVRPAPAAEGAAEGLIPELPHAPAPSGRDKPATKERLQKLPWDPETQSGVAAPPAMPAIPQAAGPVPGTKRHGSALPEQRAFFWEAARLLSRLLPVDAAALWMDDPDELRPILVFSDRPLSPELQQQILSQSAACLPSVEMDSIRILTRPEKREVTPVSGSFMTSFLFPLGEEGEAESTAQDLLLLFRLAAEPFSEYEQSLIRQVGRLLRLHLEEGRLHERYHRAFLSVSHRILKSGEARAPKMRERSLLCAKLSRSVALRLELSSSDVEAISIAAILHDVGSLLLDPDLMKKPSLSGAELATVRTHPLLAETFLKGFRFPFDVLKIIRHHHERWDGRGYPDGLAGEAIPIGSRVIGLIEAYDAMTTGKDYKAPKAKAKAIEEIKAEAGFQFDPKAVEALLAVLNKGK